MSAFVICVEAIIYLLSHNLRDCTFKGLKINYLDKLVGFHSDGASVKRGVKEGIKAIFQRENEWLTFTWS